MQGEVNFVGCLLRERGDPRSLLENGSSSNLFFSTVDQFSVFCFLLMLLVYE